MGAQVHLDVPWRGRAKLVQMLRLAIEECMTSIDPSAVSLIPLLLCVAETTRPGRLDNLNEDLIPEVERELGVAFHPQLSALIPEGKVAVTTALALARELIYDHGLSHVLIAATDSLLVGATLTSYASEDRLLTSDNSNGFIPGEASGAILVTRELNQTPGLVCVGIGLAQEHATINSEQPLRADGLTQAIRFALADAGCTMQEVDFHITDISGEQFGFKEASLATSRLLRRRKEEFDIWHPADSIGDVGAATGVAAVVVAWTAVQKAYASGNRILLHAGNDAGRRGALILCGSTGV
jgi:3-oxoacyl-[acyl-carrier-protein] synthase-1